MAKKSRGTQAHHHNTGGSFPPFLLIGGIVLVAIAVAALVWVGLSPNRGGGTPQLQISAERLDLGKQVFDRNVRASFEITNTGTGTLTLQAPRVATALEGC
jgi:hypothetical protein